MSYKPLYKRLGISRTVLVPCLFCGCRFFAHALGAHICQKAPDPRKDRRTLTEEEWRASVARNKIPRESTDEGRVG